MSDSISIVREWDGARLVVVDGRPTLQLVIKGQRGEHTIAVTATLSMSKPKDGKSALPFANLNIGGEQVRFIPEVAAAIAGSARRVDSEVSPV